MIKIQGSEMTPDTIMQEYPNDGIKANMLNILGSSDETYYYDSIDQLKFELDLRKSIINAATALYRSRFSFGIFRKSKCNEKYWTRTEEGGFLLNNDAIPSDAITDIYSNGSKYRTECATAIVIVFYKAILDIFSAEAFNKLFTNIYLMNWQNLDPTIGVKYHRIVKDHMPGDCRYFKNPDVSPLTPEWQGENAIDLGNGTYYGHGVGIGNSDMMIRVLNSHRVPGSQTSAYLLDSATKPDFKRLFYNYSNMVT